MNEAAKAKKGVRWTTYSAVVQTISQILKISILTRLLEKADFGLVAIVMVVVGFCNLFVDLGFSAGIIHKQSINQKEYSSLYWTNIILGIILYGVICLIAPFISNFYEQPLLMNIIPWLCLNVFIASVGRQFRTVFYKKMNFKVPSCVDMLSEILSLIFATILAIKGYGVYSLVWSTVFQCALANFLFVVLGFRISPISFFFSLDLVIPFLKIGSYLVGAQVFNYFSRDFDVLIIGKFLGAEMLGGYSLAKQLVGRPYSVVNPIINKVAGPYFANFQNDKNNLRRQYLSFLSVVSGANIIIYSAIFLLAYPIVYVLYGESYLDVVILVQILTVFMLDRAIGNPCGSLLAATGKTNLDFKWNVIYFFIAPIFIFIGTAFNTTVTVAIAMDVCSLCLIYPFWHVVIKPVIGGSFTDYLKSIINIKFALNSVVGVLKVKKI